MIDALYNDLNHEQQERFMVHLNSCQKCSDEYARISNTIDIMNNKKQLDPGEHFWDNYWDNLENKLEPQPKKVPAVIRWWQEFLDNFYIEPSFIYRTVGAMAILIIGVMIGKYYYGDSTSNFKAPTKGTNELSSIVKRTALEQRTDRYLQRSKVLLLGLINSEYDDEESLALNLPHQKEVSQNLVHEASLLKQELDDPKQNQLRNLVTDLEVILLQIANLESEHDLSAVEMVKSGVDRRGILLKINLEQMNSDMKELKTKNDVKESQIDKI